MTTAIASLETAHPRAAEGRRDRPAPAQDESVPWLDRSTADGPFSLLHDAAVSIAGERGLVIRVRSGCLWVPNCDEGCSAGVCAGEEFVVRRRGTLTAFGSRGTEVEFAWPERERSGAELH